MRILFSSLLLIGCSLCYSQSTDCSKAIKMLESYDGYDPEGELIQPIKIPIDDTSGVIMTLRGTSYSTTMYFEFYGMKPCIMSTEKTQGQSTAQISTTNHHELELIISGGCEGRASITFHRDALELIPLRIYYNDMSGLKVLGLSKIRGFRINTSGKSIGVMFPKEKQQLLANAINCILNL